MQRQTRTPLQSDPLAQKLGYIKRTLDYAFGAQGDKIILDDHIGKTDVEKYNNDAEIPKYYIKHNEQSQIQGLASRQPGRMR